MLTLTLKFAIVRIEEARALQELISSVKDWQCQLSDILEPALVQHSDSPPVDVCSLLRALKVFSRPTLFQIFCIHTSLGLCCPGSLYPCI